MKMMRESSLYVAVAGNVTTLGDREKLDVHKVFVDIFEDTASKVSDVKQDDEVEVVYEIKTPVVTDDVMVREFYESLEVLLEELSEYDPHFTQFKRGDINA